MRRNKVSPLLGAVGEIDANICGAKAPIGCVYPTGWFGYTETRTRGHLDDDARLISEFRRRRTRDNFQRLNGICRNLIGKHFALLIRDRLVVYRERVLGVVSQPMEESVRIGGYSWNRQSDQRAHRRARTAQR